MVTTQGGDVVSWVCSHAKTIIETAKEIVKFTLCFFFPGLKSLVVMKTLMGLAIGILNQQNKNSLWKAYVNGRMPQSLNDSSKAYQTAVEMAGGAIGLAASIMLTYLLVSSPSSSTSIFLKKCARQCIIFNGNLYYTSGLVRAIENEQANP